MKLFNLIGVAVLLVVLGLFSAVFVSAQTGLSVTPDEITVTSTRNDDAVVTRTLLLQATEPITSLQVIPMDLIRVDGQVTLPATKIQITQPTAQLNTSAPLIVPIEFDLRNAASGEFKGQLMIDYHDGSLGVPVTVTIKDTPFLPLIALVLGVGVGLVVSTYRTQGKPRDEVLVRMGQVRTEAQAETELAPPFRSAITAALLEAESALQARNWPKAQTAVEQAEAVWLKWRRDRPDWLEQMTYADELLSSEELKADSRYLKTVDRGIREAVRDAPDLANGPRELNQRLNALANQLSRYLQLRTEIENLNQYEHLTPAQRSELASFQNRLDAMLPTEDDRYAELQIAAEQARAELVAQIAKEPAADATRGIGKLPPYLPLPVPSLRRSGGRTETDTARRLTVNAKRRLAWFSWGGYLIAIILLAGAGFSQLYVANPTFGDNPWGNYFALFLWGFGAEASRAAITDVLRSLDLPGIK